MYLTFKKCGYIKKRHDAQYADTRVTVMILALAIATVEKASAISGASSSTTTPYKERGIFSFL